MTVNEVIGERVHQLMWRKKVSQDALGTMIGCTQSAVSKKLRGKRGFLVSELMTIAAYFSVPITSLLPEQADDSQATVTREYPSLFSHPIRLASVATVASLEQFRSKRSA